MEQVQVIHPDTEGIATVPSSALPHLYASGWRLLAEDEKAGAKPEPEPPPMTRAQAAKTAKSKAAPAESEDK